MTKVLMITHRFIFGGIEKLLLDMFENRNNHDIHYDLLTLITEKDTKLIKKVLALGVGYYCLELDKHNTLERQVHHYRTLYKFIKKNNYDVVHINITSYARALDMLVVKKAGIKKRIIHSHSADERETLSRKILKPMKKLYDYTATDFLACSDNAAKYLFSKKIFEEKKYTVINNGIDVPKYVFSNIERNRIRASLGLNDGEMIIGHIGRLTEAKNHEFLLEVYYEIYKSNSNSKLLLVGDGELKNAIIEKINKLGIQKHVIMYGASSEISALLSSMDIFLFPSKWEGLGIAVIEAQCNGLPCYISENIPQTAAITSNIRQYSIIKGAKWWAEMILKEKNIRVNETDKIRKAGYDICYSVSQLEDIYKKGKL